MDQYQLKETWKSVFDVMTHDQKHICGNVFPVWTYTLLIPLRQMVTGHEQEFLDWVAEHLH
jgi:hypothetical protein